MTAEPLPSMEDFTPPATEFIKSQLESALIAFDRMELPSTEARDACKTNAEIDALYAPWLRDIHSFLSHATLAHVLIKVEENHPNLAAGIAHEVDAFLDAGDIYNEAVYDWAKHCGMDPEQIVADARTQHDEWLNTVPRHLQTGVPLDIEVTP